jgi:integrase
VNGWAFGERWAKRVMPMVLKDLMRHESVTTTEKYYVGVNAQETARFLREVTLEVTPTKKGSQQNAETL